MKFLTSKVGFVLLLTSLVVAALFINGVRNSVANIKLRDAVSQGEVVAIQRALEAGADPDLDVHRDPTWYRSLLDFFDRSTDFYEQPALLSVTKPTYSKNDIGNTAAAEVLLNAGANPNAVDGDGHSALMIATFHGNRRLKQKLIEAGANPNPKRSPKIPGWSCCLGGGCTWHL